MHREVFPQWQSAPTDIDLRPGGVDVWRIDLARLAPDLPADLGGLRGVAQTAMREILGRYLDADPARLQLTREPGGKPYLASPAMPLSFNLSHSGGLALLAVAGDLAVGIDVELERQIDDPLRLARRIMGADDVARLGAVEGTRRSALFLDLWTRMEARQKAVGLGIFARPADPLLFASFGFSPRLQSHACLAVLPAEGDPRLRFFDHARS